MYASSVNVCMLPVYASSVNVYMLAVCLCVRLQCECVYASSANMFIKHKAPIYLEIHHTLVEHGCS